MSKADQAQRISLMLDRIQQIRQRFWEVRKGGSMRPLLSMFRNMEVQNRIQSELDRIVVAAEIESWVGEEAQKIPLGNED